MGPRPFRYVRADVMPLFAAVAVGIGAAGTIITRKLFAVCFSTRFCQQSCLAETPLMRQHKAKSVVLWFTTDLPTFVSRY